MRTMTPRRRVAADPHHRPARIAMAAAAGMAAGLAGATAALVHQGTQTAAAIERAALAAAAADGIMISGMTAARLPVPPGDGTYLPDGTDRPDAVRSDQREAATGNGLTLAMLGDSTAVGYGARSRHELPGVVLARRAAAATGRPVRLVTVGLVGCGAADLLRQVDLALPARPDVAVVVVGANDIRDRIPPAQSAAQLGRGVAALRRAGVPVVVGTCPDFGVIGAIPQPLRSVLRAWSHRLAEHQDVVAGAEGAAVVPVGRLIGPAFVGRRERVRREPLPSVRGGLPDGGGRADAGGHRRAGRPPGSARGEPEAQLSRQLPQEHPDPGGVDRGVPRIGDGDGEQIGQRVVARPGQLPGRLAGRRGGQVDELLRG